MIPLMYSTAQKEDMVEVRVLVPREAFQVPGIGPLMLSQVNCREAVGLTPRRFLELLRRPDCEVAVVKLGKLRLVEAADFVLWLRSLPEKSSSRTESELDEVERVLVDVLGEGVMLRKGEE